MKFHFEDGTIAQYVLSTVPRGLRIKGQRPVALEFSQRELDLLSSDVFKTHQELQNYLRNLALILKVK